MDKEIKAKVIGWDVGGWSGKHHGLAILEISADKITLNQALSGGPFSLEQTKARLKEALQGTTKVQIGIDAPLGFPEDFQRLIQHELSPELKGSRLSWRATGQFCKKTLQKAPLSPSFSFLTSNATVALALLHELKLEHPLAILPFDQGSKMEARELYPGLLKSPLFPEELKACFRKFLQSIGMQHTKGQAYYWENEGPKTDFLDALVCAWYAAAFLDLSSPLFPAMETIIPAKFEEEAKKEGWIYYPKAMLT